MLLSCFYSAFRGAEGWLLRPRVASGRSPLIQTAFNTSQGVGPATSLSHSRWEISIPPFTSNFRNNDILPSTLYLLRSRERIKARKNARKKERKNAKSVSFHFPYSSNSRHQHQCHDGFPADHMSEAAASMAPSCLLLFFSTRYTLLI